MSSVHVLTLPFPRPPLSLNDRMHWRREADLKKQIRNAAHWVAAAARLPKDVSMATVTLTYYPATKRNRDNDNNFATLKPAIDGLVDYGLVPDDHSGYVLSRCVIGDICKPSKLTLTVEITS